MIRFISLSSGSSGNCYYLGTEQTSILIDAGIGSRFIKKHLQTFNIELAKVKGIIVSHDHADHIKGLGYLGERIGIPIYATRETHLGINHSLCMKKKLKTSPCYIVKEEPFQIGDFTITAFEVPHDGHDNVGYRIEAEGKTFCFSTDIGHITPTAEQYLSQADYMILEANYDVEMLRNGRYPQQLKERIAGPNGHLSNKECAEFIATHANGKLRYVWLCHLSQDNNTPECAYQTVEHALLEKGICIGEELQVTVLNRRLPSEMYKFE